jgi:hypothetical protein
MPLLRRSPTVSWRGRYAHLLADVVAAMGTHSLHQDTWLINDVVRQDDIDQPSLF